MSSRIEVPLRIEPDVVKDPKVYPLPVEATAEQAAQRMAQNGAGAVVVIDADGRFAGIVTDQDIVREVVAKGRDARTVELATLVKRDADCIAPSDLAVDALELMRIRGVSHLPVVVEERVIAVVSIGDICAALRQTLDVQIHTHQAAFFGGLLRE